MSDTPNASGGCLCGAVRFAAEGPADRIVLCHCIQCRRNTGAPVAAFAMYLTGQVAWTGARTFFESSPGVIRGFCARCGTPVSYEGVRAPGETHLYVASFDDPEPFRPDYHVFMNEKIGWFDVHDRLPRWANHAGVDDAPVSTEPMIR